MAGPPIRPYPALMDCHMRYLCPNAYQARYFLWIDCETCPYVSILSGGLLKGQARLWHFWRRISLGKSPLSRLSYSVSRLPADAQTDHQAELWTRDGDISWHFLSSKNFWQSGLNRQKRKKRPPHGERIRRSSIFGFIFSGDPAR